MAGQDNLHIVRASFAAWNAHDVEGFIKVLDTKTTWESDVFPAPFTGHEGARQFFKLYLTAFPDLHLDIEQILQAARTTSSSAGAPAAPTRARSPRFLPLDARRVTTAAA